MATKKRAVKTQTVEQTSKKLKKETLIGVGILLVGVVIMYFSLVQFKKSWFGVAVTLIGLVLVIWNKAKIWWYHK